MPDLALRPPSVRFKGMEIHHVVRMLFSCLVDADYLDTEQFMDETSSRMRESYSSIVDLKERLDRYIGRFSSSAPSVVNRLRSEVQRMCEERSG